MEEVEYIRGAEKEKGKRVGKKLSLIKREERDGWGMTPERFCLSIKRFSASTASIFWSGVRKSASTMLL
jgi:hypothetical protein